MADDDSFLSRWSRRKAVQRQGGAVPAEPALEAPRPPPPATPAGLASPAAATQAVVAGGAAVTGAAAGVADAPPAPALSAPPAAPTFEDVARLDRGSDFRRFVGPGVDGPVRNAALKKLFSDPHFNVMDGLDTYIDDYGKPDPLPLHLLRQMTQSRALGLFEDEARADDDPAPADAAGAPLTPPEPPRDENADLRLQPDDAAGPGDAGPDEPGAGQDPAGQR